MSHPPLQLNSQRSQLLQKMYTDLYDQHEFTDGEVYKEGCHLFRFSDSRVFSFGVDGDGNRCHDSKLTCSDVDRETGEIWDLWLKVRIPPNESAPLRLVVEVVVSSMRLVHTVSHEIRTLEDWESYITNVLVPEVQRTPCGMPPMMRTIIEEMGWDKPDLDDLDDTDEHIIRHPCGHSMSLSKYELGCVWMQYLDDGERDLLCGRYWCGYSIWSDEEGRRDDTDMWVIYVYLGVKVEGCRVAEPGVVLHVEYIEDPITGSDPNSQASHTVVITEQQQWDEFYENVICALIDRGNQHRASVDSEVDTDEEGV